MSIVGIFFILFGSLLCIIGSYREIVKHEDGFGMPLCGIICLVLGFVAKLLA